MIAPIPPALQALLEKMRSYSSRHTDESGSEIVYMSTVECWADELERALSVPPEPTEQPDRQGRFILNAYGRECYERGIETGKREALERAIAAPPLDPPTDDESRCAVCGWSLDPKGKMCRRGNCSLRPLPTRWYAPERAEREGYGEYARKYFHEGRSPDGDGPSTNAEPDAQSREREKVTRLAADRLGMHMPAGSTPADSLPLAHPAPDVPKLLAIENSLRALAQQLDDAGNEAAYDELLDIADQLSMAARPILVVRPSVDPPSPAVEVLKPDAWQPIDTAPENQSILIYMNWEHYGPGIYRAILVNMGTGRRWHTTGWAVGRDIEAGYPQPTHWMPLPATPAIAPPLDPPKDVGESAGARIRRFNETTGALTWNYRSAAEHPDRCVCQGDESTPHKHYSTPPYACARCAKCGRYRPVAPPAVPEPTPGETKA